MTTEQPGALAPCRPLQLPLAVGTFTAWAAQGQVLPTLGALGGPATQEDTWESTWALCVSAPPLACSRTGVRAPGVENPPPTMLCDPGQLTSLPEPQLPHLQNEGGRHALLRLSPWAPPFPPLSCPLQPPLLLGGGGGTVSPRPGLHRAAQPRGCGRRGACVFEGRSCPAAPPRPGNRRRGPGELNLAGDPVVPSLLLSIRAFLF